MGFLANLKGSPADPDQSDYDAATATGPLAELAARPLPQLAADLFEASFAPGTTGWRKGFSQTDGTRQFLQAERVGDADQVHVANALVAEAFQLLDRRGLICQFLADGSSTVHVHWYVTRAGRAAARAGTVRTILAGAG